MNHETFHLLAEAVHRIHVQEEPGKLLDDVIDDMSLFLKLDLYAYYRWDAAAASFGFAYGRGFAAELTDNVRRLPPMQVPSVPEEAADAAGAALQEEHPLHAIMEAQSLKASVCFALYARGRLLGLLGFGSREQPSYTSQETALAEKLLRHAAVALGRLEDARRLVEAKEQADKANKAKSEFLSLMSHELRTPLNSILGYSQIMLEHDQPLSEAQRDRVLKILKSGRHLIGIINEILEQAQMESGKIKLKLERISLNCAIEDSIRLLAPLLEARQLSLISDATADPLYVYADYTRLKQILFNLLSNAIKYNRMGGSVTIRFERAENEVMTEIEDTGIGIATEQLPLIFEPFYRVYDPTLPIEGNGLGLTLVKNFVYMMNGTVSVSSVYGQGSSFRFTLPPADESPAPADAPSEI